MQVIRDLTCVHFSKPTVLTIGSFDGIHRGHQHLIAEVVARAKEIGAASALVTLHPHPRIVLRSDSPLQYLSTIEERIDLLEPLGLDYLVILPFSLEYSQIRARNFFQMLVDYLNSKELYCGADFAMGYKREGNVNFLRALGGEKGFVVHVVTPQRLNGAVISSTRVRELVASGELDLATQYLGRFPTVRGRVVRGDQRGRQLGFPTANLAIAERRLVPANGIYAGRVLIGEQWHPSAASIGIRPTFGGGQRLVEVYVIDFDGDLYDQVIELQFIQRLREELRFENVQALIDQMKLDVIETRGILAQLQKTNGPVFQPLDRLAA